MTQWLFESSTTFDVRTEYGVFGSTPMYAACNNGHLHVVKWLFEVGAADDIRTIYSPYWSLMYAASVNNHLDVAKWLFVAGDAEDTRVNHKLCWTPLYTACFNGHLNVAKWLFEVGTADDLQVKDKCGKRTSAVELCSGALVSAVTWTLLRGSSSRAPRVALLCTTVFSGQMGLAVP